MRICMITSAPWPPSEGIGNYVASLSQELSHRGHEITVLTRGGICRAKTGTHDSVKVVSIPFFPLYTIHTDVHSLFLKSYLKQIEPRPDLVHYHSPLVPYLGVEIPTVATVHTPMAFDVPEVEVRDARSLATRLLLHTTSRRTEGKLFREVTAIATVSRQVRTELLSLGIGCPKIVGVGNGVDTEVFKPSYECERESESLLTVGRLAYRKGLFDLLECARLVLRSHPSMRFQIVGEGPLKKRLQAYAESLGISNRVSFLGRVSRDSLVHLYQSCTAFVMPSHYEGMATVLLEAMACGAPVVATAIGGSEELITDGMNGLLVPPKNPLDIEKGIERLLSNPPYASMLGRNARETILNGYSWPRIAEVYEALYRDIIEEGKESESSSCA